IGNALQEREEKLVVLYQTADRFVNEFINSIRFNKYHQFQQKYRDLDVLLIDDIQFLSGKEQTQEAFFHIFNAFYDAHKQIVFSSDIFPRQIEGLAERLRSRLEWGLVTDIHKPPLETKIAILKKKAAIHGETLNDEIAEYVAHKADSNVRELEGSLIRILAYASLTKQPLSLELAQKVLAGQQAKKEEISIDFNKITHLVCKRYSYRLSDLRSTSRAKELSLVRQIAMYLMKKMTDKSLREIGIFLGRKDHSTVIHAFEKIEQTVKKDALFGSTLKALEEDILR
ncbi:chromosomal replication initiator protein DnaA, partial [bacterium]|nr:chromosomal replication initiator protein DnaA [bacterium]